MFPSCSSITHNTLDRKLVVSHLMSQTSLRSQVHNVLLKPNCTPFVLRTNTQHNTKLFRWGSTVPFQWAFRGFGHHFLCSNCTVKQGCFGLFSRPEAELKMVSGNPGRFSSGLAGTGNGREAEWLISICRAGSAICTLSPLKPVDFWDLGIRYFWKHKTFELFQKKLQLQYRKTSLSWPPMRLAKAINLQRWSSYGLFSYYWNSMPTEISDQKNPSM